MGTRITLQSWDDEEHGDGIDTLRRTLYLVDDLRASGLTVKVTGSLDIQARWIAHTPATDADESDVVTAIRRADATSTPAG